MWFFLVFGTIFLLYFLGIAIFMVHGSSFFIIWLAAAMICFAIFFLLRRNINPLEHLPGWLRKSIWLMLLLGAAIFIFVEGCIISQFSAKAPPDLDYLIVLGAQMKTTGPSSALKSRLDAAYDYLIANERTRAVLSGGQGADEPVSEAQGMYDYLVNRGIDGERLILEDQSTNTYQNLSFSAKYLEPDIAAAAIVTNNFHVFRAKKIAEKAGYQKIYGIASSVELPLLVNNMAREFFGVVKDFLTGNI